MPDAKRYGHGRNNMGELLTPTHVMLVGVIALILFGGNKLPELGKGLGAGLRGFKDGIKGLADEIDGPGQPAATIVPKPNESLKGSQLTP
jgi:sec-independent protein translocase protein TatA